MVTIRVQGSPGSCTSSVTARAGSRVDCERLMPTTSRSRPAPSSRRCSRIRAAPRRRTCGTDRHRPRVSPPTPGRVMGPVGKADSDRERAESPTARPNTRHLGAQLERGARCRVGRDPFELAARRDPHAGERVEAHHEVAAAHPVPTERHHEVVVGIAMKIVAQIAVGTEPEPRLVDGRVAETGQRVVTPARVGDDREQDAAEVGEEDATGAQEDLVLDLHRVGCVEAFARLIGVVREQRAGLAPVDVDDLELLPAVEDARPVRRRARRSPHSGCRPGSCRPPFGTTPARVSPRGRQTSRAFLPPCNSVHGHAARSLSVLTRTRPKHERRNPRDRNCHPER